MFRTIAAALLAAFPAFVSAQAQQTITYDTDQSFEDVVFGLKSAILGEGLVIDSVSHTGAMLERTRAVTDSETVLFEQADIFSFCSASVSRQVMEADPMNIAFCPYDIFVFVRPDAPGTTTIGYRSFPAGSMDPVTALLDGIAREAIGLN